MDKTELPYTLHNLSSTTGSISDLVGSNSTVDPGLAAAHLAQGLFLLAQQQAANVSFVLFRDQNGRNSIHKTTRETDTLATTSAPAAAAGAVLLVDSECQLFECKPRCCSKFLNEWISRDVDDNAEMTCDNCTGAVATIDENVREIAATIFLSGICEQIVSQAHTEIVSPPTSTSSAGPAAALRGTWRKSTALSTILEVVAADEKAAKQKKQKAVDADRKREAERERQRQIAQEDKWRSESERKEAVAKMQKQDQVTTDERLALQLQTDEQNAVEEERLAVIELNKELKKALIKHYKKLATILKQDEQKKRVREKLAQAQRKQQEEQRKREGFQTFKTAVTSEAEKQMKEIIDKQPPLAKHLQNLQVDAQVRHFTKPHANADPSQLEAMVEEVAGKVMARLYEIARKTYANELRQQQATKVKAKTAVKVSEMANAQTAQTAQAAGAIAAVVAGSQEAASGAVDMELDDVDEVAASEIEIETPVVTAQDKQMVTPLVRRQLNCDDAADVGAGAADVAQTKKRLTAQERFAIYSQNMTKLQQCKKQEETAGQPGETEDVFDSNVGARAGTGTNGGDGGDGDDNGVEKRQRKRTATPSRATEVRARSRARNDDDDDDDDDDDADLGDCNRDSLVFFAHIKAHFRY